METNEVLSLIEKLQSTDYAHIEITHEGTHVVLDKSSMAAITSKQVVEAAIVSTPPVNTVLTKNEVVEPIEIVKADDTVTIDSPIVGTFYESANPESEPYVKIGDHVKKGDIVCIIEAMKLMNEIESELDGEVVEVLVKTEGPVEYGQALFRIKQS